MAGGFGFQKNLKNNNINKNELESSSQVVDNAPKFSLKGILNLGQSIEVNKTPKLESTWKKEYLFGQNNIQRQEETLVREERLELQQEIKELTAEIKKLVNSVKNLDSEVEKVAFQPVIDANEYQIGFLKRIKNLIVNFNQNISEAGAWMESFMHKSKKKNAFWNKAKSKNGGEQYLMSSEHSASRSAN
ncbi:MAG: DUF5660 family protein [Candidatus Shapirobacteria bacterium]